MSLITIIQELWRFIKDRLGRIILGSLLITALVVAARYGLTRMQSAAGDQAYQQLSQVYLQTPAEFQFVAMQADGAVFSNSFIFDEYFRSEEIIDQLEAATGVKIEPILEAEEKLEIKTSNTYRGSIAGIRDTSSGVITLRFHVANQEADNLRLAQVAADHLMAGKIPFTEGMNLMMLNDPSLEEHLSEDDLLMVSTPKTLSVYQGLTRRGILIYAVLGLFIGLVLTVGFLFVRQLMGSTIEYAFDYSWTSDTQHIMVRDVSGPGYLAQLLQLPLGRKQWILSQSPLLELATGGESQDLAGESLAGIDEIIIVIQSGITNRQWYQEQYQLAQLYQRPIRIVHYVRPKSAVGGR